MHLLFNLHNHYNYGFIKIQIKVENNCNLSCNNKKKSQQGPIKQTYKGILVHFIFLASQRIIILFLRND